MTGTALPDPPPSTTDFSRTRRSLLVRLQHWDDNAGWQEFMDRYGGFIFGMSRKWGFTAEEAEDIVQDVLVSVAKQIPAFRYAGKAGSFRAWLVMIIKSRITDHLRKKYRRLPASKAFPTHGDEAATRLEEQIAQQEDALSHETIWRQEWENYVLEAALASVKGRLPAKHFLAFRMCSQQQRTPAEVAKALGMPLAKIYLIRHRAGRMVAREIALLHEGKMI